MMMMFDDTGYYSLNTHSEDDSRELLKAVVALWVGIQGFSLCVLWMENYKKEIKF